MLAVAISCWKQAYVLLELDMSVQKIMLEIMLVWIYGLSNENGPNNNTSCTSDMPYTYLNIMEWNFMD